MPKPPTDPLETVHNFLAELDWCTTRKYVELLRDRGHLLQIGRVDVDVPQIIQRHFVCDARRCLQTAGPRTLVDRSCCCRFEVPLTTRDRRVVLEHLDQVRPNLPDGHRLLDPDVDPFKVNDEFGYDMVQDNELGGCQFNVYSDGQCRCVLHQTALEHGENPQDWKPIACSLWPLAINAYDNGGEERLLLTIYCEETTELFDDTEEEPFACIADQDSSYPRTYQSEKGPLQFLFGETWWRQLDAAASELLAEERDAQRKKRRARR